MRLTAALILFACLHVSAGTLSQDRISLKLQSADLKKVLAAIEKKTDYRFLYNDALITNKPKVDINVTNEAVTAVLDQILQKTGIGYRVLDNKLVVLRPVAEDQPLDIQDVRITGKVSGPTGEGLAGVSVTIKGTSSGVTTDAGGNFAITVPDENVTLVFSYVGFETQELPVAGKTTINVTLVASDRAMDQVVVIGYGTASKRDLTGSIVKIAGKEIADKPNTNPVASLQGKVAGLSIVNSGVPGQEPDIRIRGTISRYQTKPLYVVDGIWNDNINFINPADIESIEVLKDPSSLAVFGIRGASGVIIVTTKKGRIGNPLVTFSSSVGFKKIVDKPELTDATGFKTLYDEQRVNQGDVPYPYYSLFTGNTDWIDLIQKENAIITNNNVGISSGTERNKFYFGVGYILEEGLIKHEKLDKITLTFNDELRVNKAIKLGVNFNGYRAMLPQVHSFSGALIATPIVTPFNSTYNAYNKLPEAIGGPQIGNPLMGVEATKNTDLQREYRFVGSFFGEVNFLNDFTFRVNYLGDLNFINRRRYTPLINVFAAEIDTLAPQSGFTTTGVGQSENTFSKFQQDYLLTYKKKFGEHSLTVLGGFTTYYESYSSTSGTVSQRVNGDPIPNDKRWWYLNVFPYGDPSTRLGSSDQWERSTASVLGRVLYNFGGKYMVNASFRRDGSSEISSANRWNNFWAVGAAWELSRENFMNGVDFFDYVKLKASVGKQGNQATGIHYPYYPNYITGQSAPFGETIVPAYVLRYRNDPNLRWEFVNSWEAGVELASFKNRLRFEFNYYNKTTDDLLTFVDQGADEFYINSGRIANKGIEVIAAWNDQLSNGLGYTLSANLTTINNEVEKVYTEGFDIIEGPARTLAGYPIAHFYGYVHDGIYQSYADKLGSPNAAALGDYGPGDIKFKDLNNDGVIDVKDRTVIGNPTPDLIYGMSVGLNFKGFDFSVDMQGVYGNEIWRAWGNGNSFAQFNYRSARLDRWTAPGTSNWEPRVTDLASINRENSTYMIEDGSYFRIRNVQIGYNFNPGWLTRAHVKNLRLYVNGQNLKTWKRNSGFTPEAGGSATSFGIDNGGYPIPAIISFGLNVSF
ncbi:MAG TPA: TonB-dependent receptor [Chitinophagaceae bacterium]